MSKATDQFTELFNAVAPLPWALMGDAPIVVDADGRAICATMVDDSEAAYRIAGAIVCAVNTCGGFRIEDPTLTAATKVSVPDAESDKELPWMVEKE